MTEPEQPVVAQPLRAAEIDCPECGGYGWTAETTADPLPSGEPGEPYQVQRACDFCGGTGRIGPHEDHPFSDSCAHPSHEAAALAVEAVRPETDIDPERLALALAEHYGPRLNFPGSFASDARAIAAFYRATPLAERPE